MNNQRTPFYENAEQTSPRDFNDLREENVYKNISQMVREGGDGSEDDSLRWQSETNSNLTLQEMEGDLYTKADREENAAKLLDSSCEGWVYVNSNLKKKPLHKDVVSGQAKRHCDENQSITENNNKINVAFFDIQSQQKQKNKANIIHSEFLSGSKNQKLETKGKINLRVMPANVEKPAEINTENKSHSESHLNTEYGVCGNQIEREISYVNLAGLTLENESIYIDMDNESSISDAYVDMYPIFPTDGIPSDSEILKEEIGSSINGTAFHTDMAEEKVSSSEFNGLKERLNCSGHACNINKNILPNKPQPAPRTLPKNKEQGFQSKPCPVPRVRSNQRQPYSHDSKSVLKDSLVNEAGQDLPDTNHNLNPTSRDIKQPTDTVSQFSGSFDEHTPPPSRCSRGLQLPLEKQHLPTSIHQPGGQKLTPHSPEDGQCILKTPPPLPHKDERNLSLNRSIDNLSSSECLPPPIPVKDRQTSIIKQSQVDEDKNDIPPKLFPRKSAQKGKSRTTPRLSQRKDYEERVKLEKSPDSKTLEDIRKPPRPPKTYLQQGNGASDFKPHALYNYANHSTFFETGTESTFPSPSNETGLAGLTLNISATTRKLGYGLHLHDGPWYACRDVTRLPSNGDNQSDLDYDYAYNWFEQKKQPKVSSATSTKSLEAKENGADLNQIESDCRKINRTETEDGYEDMEDWEEQQRAPIKRTKDVYKNVEDWEEQQRAPSKRTEDGYEDMEDWEEQQRAPIKKTKDGYEDVEDWEKQQSAPIKKTKDGYEDVEDWEKQQSAPIKKTRDGYEDVEDWDEQQRAPIKKTRDGYEDVEDWEEQQRAPIKSQKQNTSINQSGSYVFSDKLSRTQNAFELCETRMPQEKNKMTFSTTKEIGGADFKTREERKPDTRETDHRIQEKKNEKSSTPKKIPDNYIDIAEKVVKQIEKSSQRRNEDFEDFDLIQLYLAAKESLKN